MDWNALGAIGEVGGAIGVIATLLYLSLQIRSSAKATESQVHVSLSSETERLALAMSTDDALADAMLIVQANGELTPKQRLKLEWWFGAFMRVCESHFIQHRLLEATSINLETPIANVLRNYASSTEMRRMMQDAVAMQTATHEFLSWLESEVLTEASGRS